MNYKPYSHNSITFIDGQGKKITVEVKKEIAAEWNRFNWREDYQERKRRAPVKGKDDDGNTLDFDPMGDSRECSLDNLIENGGEPYLRGVIESFEDYIVKKMYLNNLLTSITPSLTEEEINILATEANGISSKEYENLYGTPARKFRKQRKDLFDRIRSFAETREKEHARTSL